MTQKSFYIIRKNLFDGVLDAIERIEISLRAQWANVIATKYGPFAHEDVSLFKDQNIWQTGYDELVKEYIRSKETFAEHFRIFY